MFKQRKRLRCSLHAWRLQCGRQLRLRIEATAAENAATLTAAAESESKRSLNMKSSLDKLEQELAHKKETIEAVQKRLRMEGDLRASAKEAAEVAAAEQLKMEELLLERTNSLSDLTSAMKKAKVDHTRALKEREDFRNTTLQQQRASLLANHADSMREKEKAHESAMEAMLETEKAALDTEVQNLHSVQRRVLAKRTLALAKHAKVGRNQRLVRRYFHAWLSEWHHPIVKAKLVQSREDLLVTAKQVEDELRDRLGDREAELFKFQQSLLRATSRKGKTTGAGGEHSSAKDPQVRARSEKRRNTTIGIGAAFEGTNNNKAKVAETTFAERMEEQFEEAEAFFVSGKLLKDNSLLQKSHDIFRAIDDAFLDSVHVSNTGEAAATTMDKDVQLLHARAVSWQSMTCSALSNYRDAISLGERSAQMFDDLNDLKREFATLFNMFQPIMRMYCNDDNTAGEDGEDGEGGEDFNWVGGRLSPIGESSGQKASGRVLNAKANLLRKAMEHCERMQALIETQDTDHTVFVVHDEQETAAAKAAEKQKKEGETAPRFGSASQREQLTWRMKHLKRVLEGAETAAWVEETSQLTFRSIRTSARGQGSSLSSSSQPPPPPAGFRSRNSSAASRAGGDSRRSSTFSDESYLKNADQRSRRESRIYTSTFAVDADAELSEAEKKRRSLGKRGSMAHLTASHMKQLDIGSAPRGIRSAAQGVLTVFKSVQQSKGADSQVAPGSVDRQRLVAAIGSVDSMHLVQSLPGGRTLLRKTKTGQGVSVSWNEFVGLIQAAALELDEAVDHVGGIAGDGDSDSTLLPAAQHPASRKKPAHFRRKSVMALATLGLTKTRVRAISKEATTPLERAVQRQEQRRMSQDSHVSSSEYSTEDMDSHGAQEGTASGPVKSSVAGVVADARRGSVRTISPIFHVDDNDDLDDHVVL